MTQRINTITGLQELFGLKQLKHPLISVIWVKDLLNTIETNSLKFSSKLFMVSLKDGVSCSIGYGRNTYDFNDGTMIFSKPNQVFETKENQKLDQNSKGWILLFHPDLIRKSELGKTIDNYSFFDYEVNEALHLSEQEKTTVTDLVKKIETEINQNIDKHSQKLMISTLDRLLQPLL